MSNLSIYSYNDKNTTPFIINYKSRNKETSLTLIGNDSYNYGQDLLTNLLHLTENFCNTTPPLKPIQGQVYYNSQTKKLNVFNTSWNEINIKPNTDKIDIIYVDSIPTISNSSLVLDTILKSYITYDGPDTLCSILSSSTIELNNEAVTKLYVDTVLTEGNYNFVAIDGQVSMTGPLLLGDLNSSSPDGALANIRYVQTIGSIDPVEDTSDTSKKITTYTIKNTTTNNLPGLFTSIQFNAVIAAAANSITIDLPVNFMDSAVAKIKPAFNMVVNCKSIGKYTKLHVTIVNNHSFTITRPDTTGELNISGSVMGLQALPSNNSVS